MMNPTEISYAPKNKRLKEICHWEGCGELASHWAVWTREAWNGREDALDRAVYCDTHLAMAKVHGASEIFPQNAEWHVCKGCHKNVQQARFYAVISKEKRYYLSHLCADCEKKRYLRRSA